MKRLGDPCGLTIDLHPESDPIEVGQYIRSPRSAYLVTSVRQVVGRYPRRWSMRCVRVDPAGVPHDAKVTSIVWYRRERRRTI